MTPESRRQWIRTVLGMPKQDLPDAQKVVLLALETFADWRDGTNARPAVATLSTMCNCDRRTVTRALARGRQLHLLELTANAAQHHPAVYRLVLPAGLEAARQDSPDLSEEWARGDSEVRPEMPRGDSPVHPGVTGQTPYLYRDPTELGVLRKSGTSPAAPIAAHTNRVPSRFCDRHPQGTRESCGDCGNARTAFNAWQAAAAEQDLALAAADDLERRRRRRLAESCPDCCGTGRRTDPRNEDFTIPCDHESVRLAGHA